MVRGPWIYNTCAMLYIICCEVKTVQLMMIDTVVLEKDDLAGVTMTIRTISICGVKLLTDPWTLLEELSEFEEVDVSGVY